MRRVLMLLLLAAVLASSLTGCVVERGRDPQSTLPANEPASWEGKSLGVPI